MKVPTAGLRKAECNGEPMARILEVDAPIRVGDARDRNMPAQPSVIGFKQHPMLHCEWLYFDMAKEKP